MARGWTVSDLTATILNRSVPTVTMWNRLEGRPRTERFQRALQAEVRDALWLLTRQWQMGEFAGDDAASPITAKVQVDATRLRRFRAGQHPVEPFDDGMPLEARVEARPVTWTQSGRDMALDLRLVLGRQWLKMLAGLGVGDVTGAFAARYPLHDPDPADPADAPYAAHPEVLAAQRAVAGRRMDGWKLYLALLGDPPGHAWDGIPALDGLRAEVDALADRFVVWCQRLIYQPGATAWTPDRLEYQFAVSAPAVDDEHVFVAEQYHHGYLDWYSLDADTGAGALDPSHPASESGLPESVVQVLLPAPMTFEGMPHTRWWTFEDGRTNFGDVNPDTTDVGKLLLMEFALLAANDWFLVPFTVAAGSVAQVRGIAVTDVFGERTWVEAAGAGEEADWQRWAMFSPSARDDAHTAASTAVVLPPTAVVVGDGDPVEDVMLVRDEIANLVWAVERTVPLPTGTSKPGADAARETRELFEAELVRRLGAPPTPPPLAETAAGRYEVMSSVPEHWVPFLPVHVDGDNREVQLQRGAIPRLLAGDPEPRKIRPRTSLLRHGLEPAPHAAYFLHEEEVPRAGVQVTQRFERTRWRDGRVWLWLAARKQTGRGEGSSGLAFDLLVNGEQP
jgi:hypothetical protein